MFVQITSAEDPGIEPDQIVALWQSQNVPAISIPGRELLPTKCHAVGVQFPSLRYSVFLCLTQQGQPAPIYFVPNPLDCDESKFHALIQEAVHFAESMGFMMSDLELDQMSRQNVMETVGRLPFLSLEQQHSTSEPLNVYSMPNAKIPGDVSGEDKPAVEADASPDILNWTAENRAYLSRFLADF